LTALARLWCGIAIAWAVACKPAAAPPPPPKPRPIEVLTIQETAQRTTGQYLGSLLSRASVTVLPQVAGYVRKIHVRPGQRVAAGAALVEIDARDENAALNSASAQVESVKAQLALAQQQLARAEALFKEGLATAQEIDQRRADVAAATAAVRAAGAQVSLRQVALSNRTIRAAVPGVIGEVSARVGDYVTATTPLTSVGEAGFLELTVAIPAARARALALGAPIEVLGDDGAVLVTSAVSYVAPEADARTQLVEVKANFDNTVGLRPRELVRVRVVFAESRALSVPLLAVQRQAGRSFVFVVVDKGGSLAVERRLVQLGALREQGYVVTGGLAVGDRIAVSAIQALKDGAAVVLAPPKSEKAEAGGGAPGGGAPAARAGR
jgi:RND family efflux transporter MFP subunit